jgi:hypothetical protein
VGGRPDRLEQAVGEPERQQVQHLGVTEEVVDPEDLLVAAETRDQSVQGAGVGEVLPEGLLEREAQPPESFRGVDLAEPPTDGLGHPRGKREVEHRVVPVGEIADEAAHVVGVGHVEGQVARGPRHLRGPLLAATAADERVGHLGRPGARGDRFAADAPDLDLPAGVAGQQHAEAGEQQSRREVPGRPQHHQGLSLRAHVGPSSRAEAERKRHTLPTWPLAVGCHNLSILSIYWDSDLTK